LCHCHCVMIFQPCTVNLAPSPSELKLWPHECPALHHLPVCQLSPSIPHSSLSIIAASSEITFAPPPLHCCSCVNHLAATSCFSRIRSPPIESSLISSDLPPQPFQSPGIFDSCTAPTSIAWNRHHSLTTARTLLDKAICSLSIVVAVLLGSGESCTSAFWVRGGE